MTEKDIKPIPKYILKLIKERDKQELPNGDSQRRFYAYLSKFGGELVKVTVAVKNRNNKARDWVYKQVAVHTVNSDTCLVKDMEFYYIAGYVVGWYEQGLQKHPKWYESPHWCLAYSECDPKATIVNREYALKIPKYKYSQADKYPYMDLFRYLRFYEEYPQAEMLVKFGLYKFATSKMILSKMGKDIRFCKWLARHSKEIEGKGYYANVLLRAYQKNLPLNITQLEMENKKFIHIERQCHQITQLFSTKEQQQDLLKYLLKQQAPVSSYRDYLQACLYLDLDMNLPKNKLPHDFRRWHDIRIDEYRTAKAMKDAEERKELYARFAAVAEKYFSLQRNKNDAFIVIIAKSPYDLIYEGEVLNHCVGRMNYDQRFIREESLIFFIRAKDNPTVPFVTVEYSPSTHQVLQCYGDGDTRPNENVLDFVKNKWLPYANQQLKQIAA